jgi:hypothetical protein
LKWSCASNRWFSRPAVEVLWISVRHSHGVIPTQAINAVGILAKQPAKLQTLKSQTAHCVANAQLGTLMEPSRPVCSFFLTVSSSAAPAGAGAAPRAATSAWLSWQWAWWQQATMAPGPAAHCGRCCARWTTTPSATAATCCGVQHTSACLRRCRLLRCWQHL